MTYYRVEFPAGSPKPHHPKRFRTEEKAKQHARKVLGITEEGGLGSKVSILPVSRNEMPLS
jgi:hypothetical protein